MSDFSELAKRVSCLEVEVMELRAIVLGWIAPIREPVQVVGSVHKTFGASIE